MVKMPGLVSYLRTEALQNLGEKHLFMPHSYAQVALAMCLPATNEAVLVPRQAGVS